MECAFRARAIFAFSPEQSDVPSPGPTNQASHPTLMSALPYTHQESSLRPHRFDKTHAFEKRNVPLDNQTRLVGQSIQYCFEKKERKKKEKKNLRTAEV
jgi:hypothetical protein